MLFILLFTVNCGPGSFINGDECIPCRVGTYQNESFKTYCYECGEDLSTEDVGSESADYCQSKLSSPDFNCLRMLYSPLMFYSTATEKTTTTKIIMMV